SNQNVSKAVDYEIGEIYATPCLWGVRRHAIQISHFRELFSVLVVKQRIHLLVMRSRVDLLYFGIDMAIGNEQVEPAIIVIVKKAAAEAENVVCWSSDAKLIADFVEVSSAVAVPDMVRRSLEVRNIQIQPAVIIIVTQ